MLSACRVFSLVSVFAVSSLVAVPALGQAPMQAGEHFAVTIDSGSPSAFESYATADRRVFELSHKGATYIALHFSMFDLEDEEMLIVSDLNGGQRYTLTGKGKMESGTFWAQHIKGDTVIIEYLSKEGEEDEEGDGFVIDQYVAGNVDLGGVFTEAVCGADDKKNAVCYQSSYPTEYDRGRAVARLLINGSSLCTGWLASANNHLITNEHCITTSADAQNTDYEFMAEAPNCSDSNCQLCFAGTVFSGATYIQDSPSLDYALVQITSGNPAGTYGYLNIDNRTAVVGEEIYIPQYPGGRAKEFGIESSDGADSGGVCHVTTFSAPCSGSGYNDVGYQCDTEGGSSGSPVLARSSHQVIALHHCANCPNRGVPIDLICAEICSLLGPQCNSDPECDDGLWCNGSETCSGQQCQPGTDPCPGQSCDEATNQCVAPPAVVYEWTMDADPGWTTQGLWAFGQPAGGGGQYGGPDPTSGATGNNVYGYNLSGDYENSLGETHLTSTPIDCSALSSVTLKFQRWLGVEQPTYDHAYVRVSNDGSSWTTVWQNSAQVADSAWSLQEFDISGVADGQSTVYLRWTMGTTDGSWQFCGWNVDDVQILAFGGGGGCTVPADCDDGVFCNGAEDCVSGACQSGTPPACNDGVACTDDSCNTGTDSCQNAANDANCDDGLYCNGSETCDAVNDCQAGTAINCGDGVACTDDSCNEGTNSCDNVANDANCDDGVFCNGAETCDAVNDCQTATAPTCDDGVGCTDDSCNTGTDSCDNIANNANCDDGLFCNGTETCDAVNDCQAGTAVNCGDGVSCTDDSCNEGTNSCDNVANDGNCDDGLACNGTETCDAVNDCQAGTTVNCNDGVACTTDACNEPGGTCSNTPDDAACDDGTFCNGTETCDAVNDCQAGTAVNCNDGVGCTDDSCNEATNSCGNVANDVNCDNGLFCDGTETCDAVLDCQIGGDPCPGQSCDEGNNVCVSCQTDPDCDDGVYCNGAETCVGGNCQAGTAVDCNDGVACTDDACNEATSSCDNVANDGNCDDGLFCNGAETCDAVFNCQGGTIVNCDDAVICTNDSCNEGTNSCDNVANDGNCDDGLFCNGAETCDAVNDCQTGTAPTCDDGVGCTDDSCNVGTDSCDNVANDLNCSDDGLFCNGVEFCDAAADCSSTGDPCLTGETCNEATNTCDAGPPTGEGFILSKNADFSTDDRTFYRSETIFMKVWTDQVDFNDIRKQEWELKSGDRVKQQLTNHFDTTYTASYALSQLPNNNTDWTWKGKVEDNAGTRFQPTDIITVLDAPACSTDPDCDDGDACTTDVCSGGACSNTPINCDDGDACTADSCSGGVCFNDPQPTCCGDTFCDAGEDTCNCPADCGAPPTSETNCTDGIDEDCDGNTDCADADCSGDPACSTPSGEGYILSLNADFSTDDRTFTRGDTIYMKMWSDVVDFNDMNRERWELKDPAKNKAREPLTNHFDGTWTASYDLANLPSNDTDWTWKGEVKDNAGITFKPTDTITVLP